LLYTIAPAAEPIDVIIVAGQSNAVGFDAPPDDLSKNATDADVLFWWRCGDPPPDEHDSASNGWTTLRPQPLGAPRKPREQGDRQYGNFAQASGGFGPEIGLARAIAPSSHRALAIIKVAFSGTHVAGDWNPNLEDQPGSEHDSRGACYRSLVTETKQALGELADSYQPRIVAMVWVQGESDATTERADAYQRNIAAMISSLRTDLEAPQLIVLLAVNTKFGGGNNPYLPDVIAAQKAYAESDPRAKYVDTSHASIENNVHFDAAGTIEVGRSFAKTLADLRDESN
jgi:lysophospholipase L1-like esterase